MGIGAQVPRPGTSKAAPGHGIYPYLRRGVSITEPNHVWAGDITYIPMAQGFLYLVAITGWASRGVLAWRLSNTMVRALASRHSTKLWRGTARRKYSAPIRALSSPAQPLPAGSKLQVSRFRSTDAVFSWTIFSSNGCGVRSSTRKCIWKPMPTGAKRETASDRG